MDILFYIDEILLTGLSSLIGEGYIEIITRKRIWDRSLVGRINYDENNSEFCEDRNTKDKREGYKGYSEIDGNTSTSSNSRNRMIENRGLCRVEEEEKRIFTMFSFHNKITTQLIQNNSLKSIDDLIDGNVSNGDYLLVNGLISNECFKSYIESLKTIIDCFGCDKLNSLLDNGFLIDFNIISKLLDSIYNKICLNNTSDLILNCGNNEIILTINESNFLNDRAHKFDNIECNCNILGKVVKQCNNDDRIHFLRKTGQQEFFEDLLQKCIPAFDCLKKIGIDPPKCPRMKIENNPYQIIPVSIYV
ncbi:MAG: DUF6414 family protein [Clostridium sp.]|uniref:DUF6414 family protein n=1 Tax=Clostridium sp. TaxID=1506 RepID=UPI003F2D8839